MAGVLACLAQGACDGETPLAYEPPGAVLRAPVAQPRVVLDGTCTVAGDFWKANFYRWHHVDLRMGGTHYSQEEQLDILRANPDGNGLVALAQQLISARLNIASGVPPVGMDDALTSADTLIGALVVPPRGTDHLPTSETTTITESLAAFNEGRVGPGACTAK